MKRRPPATVRVLKLAHIAEGAVRVEIDCRYSTTGLTSIPGPAFALTKPQMITAAVFEHEAWCGDCDTSAAHERGDQTIRKQTERVCRDVQQAMTRRYAESRRN